MEFIELMALWKFGNGCDHAVSTAQSCLKKETEKHQCQTNF